MTTRVVNVRDFKPYKAYWYNQSPDSPYVYIGRWHPQIPITSKWHNVKLKNQNDMAERLQSIKRYKEVHLSESGLLDQIYELKNKILGCWCNPKPCHGDVLAELAERLAK